MTGKGIVWFKNITTENDGSAQKAMATIMLYPMPTKKTGTEFDSPPPVTDESCVQMPAINGPFSDVRPGEERFVVFNQTVMVTPFRLQPGDRFFVYAVSCVTYFEHEFIRHGTCDRYRLLENGEIGSVATDTTIGGVLVEDMTGHCEN